MSTQVLDYDAALASSPSNVKVLHNRALAHLTQDDPQAALSDFKRALRIRVDDVGLMCAVALCEHRIGAALEARPRPKRLFFCASVCAAPTRNAAGQLRVTLSLR